jgi:hypothetical protein
LLRNKQYGIIQRDLFYLFASVLITSVLFQYPPCLALFSPNTNDPSALGKVFGVVENGSPAREKAAEVVFLLTKPVLVAAISLAVPLGNAIDPSGDINLSPIFNPGSPCKATLVLLNGKFSIRLAGFILVPNMSLSILGLPVANS